ncbi:patatin-like phospholipase family protein [Eubacterium oxidoreducens]|uniref:Predicted phospholipase, patatin/cPLA2 family n=1 Tax=Eubacterium oxidoreducens TaxID=1732 RepID=A0A1G5ZZR9_EUBOX|nr:patatin family protein [Eubacterium oxidoreducens]SDB01701.1 Predicted phospholipase, patatin/cPLA2 family [Eubacterium oxidoreducens]
MGKVGLIMEGGGMRCAYGAALLDKFLDDGISFNYAIGVSAGAGCLVSYLGGQRDRNFRFYSIHLNDPDYFGARCFLRNGSFFNLSHIYHDMIIHDGVDPLNYRNIMDNPCELEMVTTNAHHGTAEYLTKDDLAQDDYWALMASCAIPIVCKPTSHNGRIYYDGGVVDSIPVARALFKGCDKLVVLLSKSRDYKMTSQKYPLLYHMLLHRYPLVAKALDKRHLVYEASRSKCFELEKKGQAFLFTPSHDPGVTPYTKNATLLKEFYEIGLQDYDNRKEMLLQFLNTSL